MLAMFGCCAGGIYLAKRYPATGGNARTEPEQKPASSEPKIEVLEVRVEPFRTATGLDTRMVYVDWKNTGPIPVRAIEATITGVDDAGKEWKIVSDWTIYATFDKMPGVAPGESYYATSGFVLQPRPEFVGQKRPSQVKVRVTKVLEKSGM